MGLYDSFLAKYGAFTSIQRLAMPIVESKENCLIIAPTGSGKTEAAMLPLFSRLGREEEKRGKGIRVIYITPLRALNRDLLKRLRWLASEAGVNIAVRHGDTPQSERQQQAANPPAVLITTPESLQNLFLSERLRKALVNVEAVVVDEAHELFPNKRGAQLAIALERLAVYAGNFQRIGISATIGNVEEAKAWLFGNRPCKIARSEEAKELQIRIEMPLKPKEAYASFRKQFGLNDSALARIERIAELIRNSNSLLLFANTRQIVESLGNKLIAFDKQYGFGGIGVHHSSLDKSERIAVEEAFKNCKIKSIIATSSLELGIDIGTVDVVVQYGSPKQATRLVQRIGRGGHREKSAARGSIIVSTALEALESLAILEQAKKGELEKYHVQANAADVVINQLCGMVLERKEISKDEAYSIITSAFPFAQMAREEFYKIVQFASEQRLIKEVDGKLGQGSRTRSYFYANISTIPENAKYAVIESVTNKVIGFLDEEFVANYLDEGVVFITKGMPWRVISIDGYSIKVEQSSQIEAAIPDWEGEDLPVTRKTAEAVFEMLDSGKIQADWLDTNSLNAIKKLRGEQSKYLMPSLRKVVVENADEASVVLIPAGKQANELIARLISFAISAAGYEVSAAATPYAVIVRFGNSIRRPDLSRLLTSGSLLNLLDGDAYLINSDVFRYRLVQVAKLSGVVEKNAVLTRRDTTRLVNFYKGTPLFEEAKRDVLANYFDLNAAKEILERIKKKEIEVEVVEGLSPFAKEVISSAFAYAELLIEPHSEGEIEELRKGIVGKRVELLCTYCGFAFYHEIKDKDEEIKCPKCGSPMLCFYSDSRAGIMEKRKKGKELSEKEDEEYESMVKEAGLVSSYSNRALIALSTYGIGFSTASRILRMSRKTYNELFVDLLIAQKNFIRTKKYWQEGSKL
ncbi:MAG: DEAD/DEAH box helicase [Candidatus Micrarchaeia archaeon]